MKKKFIGKWVRYKVSDGSIRSGRIEKVTFSPVLKKPLFRLVNLYGREFCLTREEIIW